MFFFFKQKTAYEMRISDWSSDVCSSDLLQTYAGPALAEHVIKPSIDAFNKAANGEMVIDLYTSDQLVPQGELFRAVQRGTIDAAQSDDDSMASPVDVAIFGAYFPFASRYSLDVPVLWNWYGLKEN